MTAITKRILIFRPMIKNLIVADHAFFAIVTFNRINSFTYINSIVIQKL